MGEINGDSGFGHEWGKIFGERLENHENVRNAVALIFVIDKFRLFGCAGYTSLFDELLVRFVYADNRVGIVNPLRPCRY